MKISKALSDAKVCELLFQKLEAHRKAMGVTQTQLCEALQVTPKTYRNLASGSASVAVLIATLRELNLLSQLNDLVPDYEVRPEDVFKQQSNRKQQYSDFSKLKARKKLK